MNALCQRGALIAEGEPRRRRLRRGGALRRVNRQDCSPVSRHIGSIGADDDTLVWILATVPLQHTYGMEFSVLLPLIAGMAVHAARPLFPADIARALAELPTPRVLVSTPVHLRALVESPQEFPQAALIISATAPLDRALAQAVEAKLGGRLLEIFGSTETCAFASRRTAQDEL